MRPLSAEGGRRSPPRWWAAATGWVGARSGALRWVALGAVLLGTVIVSLGMGRYPVPFGNVLGILAHQVATVPVAWEPTEAVVVTLVRLPRVLVAVLAGAGLAVAGASLQGTFRNPLVGPQIIGVASGAAFGGALALLLFDSTLVLMGLAFVGGLLAMAMVFGLARSAGGMPVLMLVLSGVVIGALFTSLVSLVKYVADPQDKLPAIVFWLLGSFAAADYAKLAWMAAPVGLASAVLLLLRWRINLLSLGEEEAAALGVPVRLLRGVVILCVAAITAAVVAVAGLVGWVGLVVPHLGRMVVGPNHNVLLPASALVGAIYLLLIDDLARTVTAAEIPLGVLTALVGAPVFAALLIRTQGRGWSRD